MNAIEKIQLPNGFKLLIYPDDLQECPWEDSDFMPPMLIFGLGNRSLDKYGDPEPISVRGLLFKLHTRWFGKITRYRILNELGLENETIVYDKSEDVQNEIDGMIDHDPRYWSCAEKYFDQLAHLCKLHKIPHRYEQINGHCQGDSWLVFIMLTPEWQLKVGTKFSPKSKRTKVELESSMRIAEDWLLGNCYCYIVDNEDGDMVDACGGFWGDDGIKEIKHRVFSEYGHPIE